jgi:diguanylate cyclase (GGDEF)-like protein
VGVLDCQSDQIDFFDSDTIDLLTLFSTQASMALQNAKLYSLERRRATQLEAINAIAKQTTVVLDIKDLLDKVCSLVLESFPVDHVSVLLKQEEHLVMRAHHGRLTSCVAENEDLPANSGLWSEAFANGRTMADNNLVPGPNAMETCKESRSRMCIPLISFGQVLGVLVLDSQRPDAFNLGDARPLESVADICATAIQNAHYVDRVRHLANIDGLTGIFNRRYFEKQIADELERSRRYDAELTVMMVDIDHFKRLNDEFGHLLGDEVLRQVSSIFSQQLRKNDVVCRYGGEEFGILLPQTNFHQALAVAEKLRKVVEAWQFPGVPRPVTISAGISSCPAHGATRDEVVKAADAALYSAKQSGRNRVIVAPVDRAAVAQVRL